MNTKYGQLLGSRFQRLWYRLGAALLMGIVLQGMGLNVFAQDGDGVTIQSVELLRKGHELSVRIFSDKYAQPKVVSNLKLKTLVVKYPRAKIQLREGKNQYRANDKFLDGILFRQIGEEVWAQFKLHTDQLTYNVVDKPNSPYFEIAFRPILEIETLAPPPQPASYKLMAVQFDSRGQTYSRVTLEVSAKVRAFVIQDGDQKVTKIRLADTKPSKELKISEYADDRIKFVEMTNDPNQTYVVIESTVGKLDVREMFLNDPFRWVFDFFGEARSKNVGAVEDVPEKEDEKKKKVPLSEKEIEKAKVAEELAKKEQEKRERRNAYISAVYSRSERIFQSGSFEQSIQLFRALYAKAKNNMGEFEDEMHPSAVLSLFRIADSIYTMLEKNDARNYHEAIMAYETAIRVANEYKLQQDLIPHALFRIARSYQKMQFHDEANVTFKMLQGQYPGSEEAAEANFWKAVSQVDRREWKSAIADFNEYLRSPDPKHVAAAHYKIAEAYYNTGEFRKAKEAFDRGRAIDLEYPNKNANLLFRMGETYYENADYATAREVFKVLLQNFPKADFSKLVALRLGDFYRDEGKEEEAIEAYKNTIGSFSREVALLGKMRIANIKAQRPYSEEYKEAVNVYDEIVTLYPNSSLVEEALLRKGLTLTLFGKYSRAIEALESYVQAYPQSVYVQRGVIQENIDENLKGLMDRLFYNKDYLGVLGIYKDYKTKYLSNFRFDTTLFQVGMSYKHLGLYDEALDIFQFLRSRTSNSLEELTHLKIAQTLLDKGDLAQARDQLVQFLKKFTNSLYDAETRKQLAEVYQANRQFSEAILVYQQTIKKYLQTEDSLKMEIIPTLYYNLANLYRGLGKNTEAADAYKEVMHYYRHPVVGENVPQSVIESHFFEADMLFKSKNNALALEKYEKAIALYLNRTDPETIARVYWAKYQTGQLYQIFSQAQRALRIYKQLMESPDGEGSLWKKLATDSHQALTQQLAYDAYLNK
ncbi:tetratricopeptide repeat protein [Deltaproteobacteria bacterium TL4]